MEHTCVQLSSQSGVTVIPNFIIDQMMAEANELQLKVYLYILRHQVDSDLLLIPRMADYFNETEKDIARAVRFWESKGICVLSQKVPAQETTSTSSGRRTTSSKAASDTDATGRPALSRTSVQELSRDQSFAELMFLAESCLGKPLTTRDLESLVFISRNLHFSCELMEFLFEYCANQGKKNFKYMEAVALAWSKEGITTPEAARSQSAYYHKQLYGVMNALGKKGDASPTEAAYVTKWYQEYGLEEPLVLEACRRTVLATDRNRFPYADKILQAWRNAGIRHVGDLANLDHSHNAAKAPTKRHKAQPAYAANNPFLQHKSSDTDYAQLEKLLN